MLLFHICFNEIPKLDFKIRIENISYDFLKDLNFMNVQLISLLKKVLKLKKIIDWLRFFT